MGHMAEDLDLRQNTQMYHNFLKLTAYAIVGVLGVLVLLVLVAL
jgi:hypothetical protein